MKRPAKPPARVRVRCPVCDKRRTIQARSWAVNGPKYAAGVRCRGCARDQRAKTDPKQSAANKLLAARCADPDRRPADGPTPFAPGTAGKIAVLCRRALTGQCLYHPADTTAEQALMREFLDRYVPGWEDTV